MADHQTLQQQIHGVEKKQLPHLLATTNMLLHGIEVPVQIRHDNTLNKPLSSWDEQLDVIVTNPPFGGTERRHREELPGRDADPRNSGSVPATDY